MATEASQTGPAPGDDVWHLLADNLPQLAWVADASGWIFWYNKRWYDYTGTTLEEMQGWGWKTVHHPDHIDDVTRHWQAALDSGSVFEFVFPLRGADGRFRDFLTRAQPLRDPEGRIKYWFGSNTDVTDQIAQQRRDRYFLQLEEILRSDDELGALRRAVAALIGSELGADRAAFTIIDPDTLESVVGDEWRAPGVASVAGIYAEEQHARIVERYRDGAVKVVDDMLTTDLYGDLTEERRRALPVRALVDVPILVEGTLVAILSVHQLAPREWTEAEVDLVQSTAERVGVIIARHRYALDLAQSEERMVRASRAAGMFTWERDWVSGKMSWGVGAAEQLGLAVEDLPQQGDFFVHPDEQAATREQLQQVLDAHETNATIAFGGADGRRWQAEIAIDYADDGTPQRMYGSTRDVTRAHTQRRRLEASEAQFRSVAEALPGILFVTDPGGRQVYVNKGYRDYTGKSEEELLEGGWPDLVHPQDRDRVIAESLEARAQRRSLRAEYRLRRHDGSYRCHVTQATPVVGPDGEIDRWVGVSLDIEDSRQADAALRASEERYRTLFEQMAQGYCVLRMEEGEDGLTMRFVELNPAFTDHTGLPQDIRGKTLSEVLPGLEQHWLDLYADVARSGASRRFVEHAASLDRWFDVYAFPIHGGSDGGHVAVLFTDISERKRQEQSILANAQEMKLRLNAIPQMVWSTLPDGFHDFYNDRWYEFTGTPLGSTDGAGWSGMFHPDDQPRAWERWKRSLETGEPYEIEYRLRHHTGEYRWVLGRALPITDADGRITRWMGTCTDIDDRIAADRALRQSEARLRSLIDAMPVGLVFAEPDGRLFGGNGMLRELLGGDPPPSSSLDQYAEDYRAFHADGRQVESEEYPLFKVLREGAERAELECLVERFDGKRRWIRYVSVPIRDPDGTLTGGVVASIDIDREKRLTEGLEREVEKVVAEREAAQEALRQSQKLEAMGQLTGGVAHDFNNLLTPIIGSLDLLHRKQLLDERTGRLVEGALASAEKARVLVQRLLAFARRQPLKPQAIDLVRVVTEMSELIDSTSGPRIRVTTDVPPTLPPALADGNQLEMALLNLSVNARDAMPEGGTLTIAARAERSGAGKRLGLGDRRHVVLSVSDTGTGMDEETRRRAIEPFFSTKGIGKGTGLGLSMVHGLAAQLGGALDIRSAPRMGTSIELWLPIAAGDVADAGAAPDEVDPHGAGTVLLVDDDELVRTSTAGMLAELGYRLIEADSGETALALVTSGTPFDFLVTDQLMPGMNGTDLAVAIRRQRPEVPVLIVSGYADLESLSPAFPHLSKPFRQAELSEALDKALAAAAAAPQG